jgi:hypothetical protein
MLGDYSRFASFNGGHFIKIPNNIKMVVILSKELHDHSQEYTHTHSDIHPLVQVKEVPKKPNKQMQEPNTNICTVHK